MDLTAKILSAADYIKKQTDLRPDIGLVLGSGLGLNIAKSLRELQNGSMQLLVDGDLFKVTLIFPDAK